MTTENVTTVKEIAASTHIVAYMVMKLTKEGTFVQLPPTFGTHRIIGGLWADEQEAKHEQMVKALLGEQYRIFEFKWKL
jgi:hypothetical protein